MSLDTPSIITNEQGVAVLSWRTVAGDYTWYEPGYKPSIDFQSSWNAPRNSVARRSLAHYFQCANRQPDGEYDTSFAAVIGNETMWSRTHSISLSDAQPNTILIIEWAHTGIEWMEPSDISVSEFLQLFKGQFDRGEERRIMYIDVSGQVGYLPRSTQSQDLLKLLSP